MGSDDRVAATLNWLAFSEVIVSSYSQVPISSEKRAHPLKPAEGRSPARSIRVRICAQINRNVPSESVKLLSNSSRKNPAYATLTDYWFSQELQAFVLVKRIGPGKSQHTIKLSDISRDEPDPSLFAVPPDYHVSEPKQSCPQFLLLNRRKPQLRR